MLLSDRGPALESRQVRSLRLRTLSHLVCKFSLGGPFARPAVGGERLNVLRVAVAVVGEVAGTGHGSAPVGPALFSNLGQEVLRREDSRQYSVEETNYRFLSQPLIAAIAVNVTRSYIILAYILT